MQILEYPVNVPISSARLAPLSWVIRVMKVPCSGPICMIASAGNSAAVSAARLAST
jgi:hypothetical protein